MAGRDAGEAAVKKSAGILVAVIIVRVIATLNAVVWT